MKLLNLSLKTPEENLALDEALLLLAEMNCSEHHHEASSCTLEILRFWESDSHFVVLGAGGKVEEEVRLDNARRDSIPVLRRDSGGGTVLQGPGCLNYTLVLDLRDRPECADIIGTNRYVLDRLCRALAVQWPSISWCGTSDLTLEGRKVSGTAQRRKKRHVLFHGTLLYGFDFTLVEQYLRHPPKEPAYRQKRSHSDFLTNLNVQPSVLRSLIAVAWNADEEDFVYPADLVAELVAKKYSQPSWNFKF